MDYIIKVRMPDALLNQAERAAASLGMTADEYLRVALAEKLRRWAQDEEQQEKMERITQGIFERHGEVFQRLARQ